MEIYSRRITFARPFVTCGVAHMQNRCEQRPKRRLFLVRTSQRLEGVAEVSELHRIVLRAAYDSAVSIRENLEGLHRIETQAALQSRIRVAKSTQQLVKHMVVSLVLPHRSQSGLLQKESLCECRDKLVIGRVLQFYVLAKSRRVVVTHSFCVAKSFKNDAAVYQYIL